MSLLQQLACAPFEVLLRSCISPPRLASGLPFLAGLLVRNLGASPHLELQDYRNEV